MVKGGYHMVTWKDIKFEIRWQWFLKTKPIRSKFWLLIGEVYDKFKRE